MTTFQPRMFLKVTSYVVSPNARYLMTRPGGDRLYYGIVATHNDDIRRVLADDGFGKGHDGGMISTEYPPLMVLDSVSDAGERLSDICLISEHKAILEFHNQFLHVDKMVEYKFNDDQ